MTSKEQAQLALDQVMVKRALNDLKGVGYFVPGYGSALSGRDALRSGAFLGHHLRYGNYRSAGASALGLLGNSAMAVADFLPFVGPAAHGIGALRAAKAVSKAKRLGKLRGALGMHGVLGAKNYNSILQGSAQGWRKLLQTPLASTMGILHKQTNKLVNRIPGIENFIARHGLNYGKVQGAGTVPWMLGTAFQNPYTYQ